MKSTYLNHIRRKRIAQVAAAGILASSLALGVFWPTAEAAELPQDKPKAVGQLVIPGIPNVREPVILKPQIDNERKLQLKLDRWEASKDAAEPEPEVDPAPEMTYLGSWRITGYDLCARCCGNTRGITASGEKAEVGVTCAGPKSLPFGTRIWIDGIGERVVQDRGGAVNGQHIDVLCNNHDECYALTGSYDVYIIEEAGRG